MNFLLLFIENELEQPSSPSVKKSEEKGIVVVHEVKCKLYVKVFSFENLFLICKITTCAPAWDGTHDPTLNFLLKWGGNANWSKDQ